MVFPSFDLTGQVALVTGAARGLGRAISLALAHAGADVALGLRDVNAGGDVADQIGAMGRRALPLQMDVRRLDQIFQSADNTVTKLGRLDILAEQRGTCPRQSRRERARRGLRSDARGESEGNIFCQPGCRTSDDPTEGRPRRRPEFASRLRGLADRVSILHDEGCHFAPYEMPCREWGKIQHHCECGGTNIHSHSRDGGRACRP